VIWGWFVSCPRCLTYAFMMFSATAFFVLIEGELQRREHDGGAINLVAETIVALGNEDGTAAAVTRLPGGEQTSLGGDDFEQVAPAVMSFAQGRRR
jgi:hypothetical protein